MIIVRALTAVAALAGSMAWLIVARADLVLAHYDAKAHLVVARRILDSITPGWQQIGAVWLPLPHLIQLLPIQVDLFYRTGAFGSLVSVACFAATAYAAARLVLLATGSAAGAVTAVALLVLNPNLLYLQATPMTEPLLVALTFLAALWHYEWLVGAGEAVPVRLRATLFAAAWTRYEAWLIIAAAVVVTCYAAGWRRAWRFAVWPLAAVVIFLVNSRLSVGDWFVSDGFFVPDPTYQGQLVKSLVSLWWGTHQMSSYIVAAVALAAAVWFTVRAATHRAEAALLIPVTLLASAGLPFSAFVSGHPFRIRYMVSLVAASALLSGLAVGTVRRRVAAQALAAALVASLLVESPPWSSEAPMIAEAQWDVPASRDRRAVTRCLAEGYHGEKVLASMGSLAHYMQELSHAGFRIADFVHEGNGDIWDMATETGPAMHVGWMLVEEQSEGGDVLAQAQRTRPSFSDGMTRVCEGGGVALYRRDGSRHAGR